MGIEKVLPLPELPSTKYKYVFSERLYLCFPYLYAFDMYAYTYKYHQLLVEIILFTMVNEHYNGMTIQPIN